MRVRAYRFRAYSSKTTAGVLKTQLEAACKQAKRKRADPEKRGDSVIRWVAGRGSGW
jgi:hypothetical protein